MLLLDGTIGPVVDVIASLHCLGDTGFTEVARIGPAPLGFDGTEASVFDGYGVFGSHRLNTSASAA